MALRRIPGVRIITASERTDQDDARLRDALRDLDHWRDEAYTAKQDAEGFADSLAAERAASLSTAVEADMARHEIDRLKREIKTLRAAALPPPMDGRPIEPTTDPVQALIGEALDMEIGGEK